MPTKLSRFCEGIMEAAWLFAMILVPLFFNIYSSRIFEPDKITILRSLGLVILLAWIVKIIEQRGIVWEKLDPGSSGWKGLLKIPLIAPMVGIALLYIVSTIFSITPSVSLWGSYQRLQGTYTTLSYLMIFAAIAANLRKRSQVERLITVIALSSLPVALYGVLQRFKIDPVPWGGDTSIRIAANMGNSIFVAAYLIMVFPLVFGRIVQTFRAILKDEGILAIQVARATVYIFIAALQIIALYMSQSRGPALGFFASGFFMFLLLSLYWQKRWLTIATVGLAVLGAAFLFVFNIDNGPLQSLRSLPAIGRFGLLLDAESNSALVRKYIWEGAADLVAPHDPLEYPDGSQDRFNFLRPLIGYGPESMYVAYNPFYVPELAQVEKRNASPDRSHNETWDSLVITGALGIIAYLAIFLSVIYYGLKWIGFVPDSRQRRLFFAFSLAGGLIGGVGLIFWRGVEYFGVGIPFGILIGLLLYITEAAIFAHFEAPRSPGEAARKLTLIVLLAGIVAHFVEINFGIAIASTRTYFWTYSALMLCVGYILPLYNQYELPGTATAQGPSVVSEQVKSLKASSGGKKRRSGREAARGTARSFPTGMREILIPAALVSTVLMTLGYNYITNSRGLESALAILWSAFTRLPNRNYALSYGILSLILTTWVVLSMVFSAEENQNRPVSSWLKSMLAVLGISGGITLIYWLIHAGTLGTIASTAASTLDAVIEQVGRYENLLASFYIIAFILLLALAYFLPEERTGRQPGFSLAGALTAGAGLIVVLVLAATTNLRVIQADIAFKLAEPFARDEQWPVAISIYNRANELAPTEDYYYLFLGRAYLEHAKSLSEADEREKFISQAADDLRKAQSINPLNTDHTANLARLYSLWASYMPDDASKMEKAGTSDEYFSKAVTLSPNSARLWDEWALLYLNIFGQSDEAVERLNHAKEIDPKYHWTFALLAEIHNRLSRAKTDPEEKNQEISQAADYYAQALVLPTPGEPAAKYNYAVSLANLRAQLGQMSDAIKAYERALEVAPASVEKWRVEETLGNIYIQMGDAASALVHYRNAFAQAPDDQKERLNTLINQLTQP